MRFKSKPTSPDNLSSENVILREAGVRNKFFVGLLGDERGICRWRGLKAKKIHRTRKIGPTAG
jgi:hypothetical protein